ncbi:MAG: hypothetical protein E7604_00430 [Ruminococcaceae bacterium]|nr:hypothetical protein [Oscillospiraceae bacterium]
MTQQTRNVLAISMLVLMVIVLIAVFKDARIDNLLAIIIGFHTIFPILFGTLTAFDAILHPSVSDAADQIKQQYRTGLVLPIIMSVLSGIWNLSLWAVCSTEHGNINILMTAYLPLLFVVVQTGLYCCCMLLHKKRDEEIRVIPVLITISSAMIYLSLGLLILF